MVAVDERDAVTCDDCHEIAERQFEGTTAFKWDHRTNTEKSIHRDLVEINQLERESANNQVRVNNNDEQARIEREVRKLKFTD